MRHTFAATAAVSALLAAVVTATPAAAASDDIQVGNIAIAAKDTWREDQQTALTMDVVSESPITKAELVVEQPCSVGTPTQPNGSGQLSIPVTVPRLTASCKMAGLKIWDSAGQVAVLGTMYSAAPLPTFERMTGPGPVLKGITLDSSSVDWRKSKTITATVDFESWSPGVTQAILTIGGRSAAVNMPRAISGKVGIAVEIAGHDVNVLSMPVMVQLTDAAFVSTQQLTDKTVTVVFPPEVNRYIPLAPTRVLDTRTAKAPIGAAQSREVTVAGLPADAAVAVLNVVATEPTARSYLTLWAAGEDRPTASNLNFVPGQTVANLVTVPVTNGKVQIYNNAGSTHVVADLFGFYRPGPGDTYREADVARALDTRLTGGPLTHGKTITTQLEPIQGLYDTTAVVLNVTVTGTTAPGYITVWGDGTPRPVTSNINFPAGWTGANQVIVQVDPRTFGKINIYNHGGDANVIVDVAGSFSTYGRSLFVATDPTRLMDTRATEPLGPQDELDLSIEGLPSSTEAVVLNVTATEPTAAGFLTVWRYGPARPLASSLNFGPGQTVPNMVTTTIREGQVSFYNNAGNTHVIADLFGYYISY